MGNKGARKSSAFEVKTLLYIFREISGSVTIHSRAVSPNIGFYVYFLLTVMVKFVCHLVEFICPIVKFARPIVKFARLIVNSLVTKPCEYNFSKVLSEFPEAPKRAQQKKKKKKKKKVPALIRL